VADTLAVKIDVGLLFDADIIELSHDEDSKQIKGWNCRRKRAVRPAGQCEERPSPRLDADA
jgi:hypothetical protein